MIYGYARVSTKEQNLQLQLHSLREYGVDQIFTDKVSTKKTNREQLELLLSLLKSGDTLVIWKLDRLGRTVRQLLDLVEYFERQDISFVSRTETIDTKSPMGRAFFTISAAFAQLERETISMRTIAGLDAARAQGRIGGRPKKNKDEVALALKMYKKGFSISEITATTSVAAHTLYKYLREEIILLYRKGMSIEEISAVSRYKKESIERFFDEL